MSWHFLERWVEKANQHSTLVGKFWITFLIVCRMVIVASVGDRVYNDEQSEFKCNTQQPGCTNVCFNSFSPISHLRFWSFQILFVATPSVMFVVYSAHKSKLKKTSSKKARISNDEDDDKSEKHISGVKMDNVDASLSHHQSGSKKYKKFDIGSQQSPKETQKEKKQSRNRGYSRDKEGTRRSYTREEEKDHASYPRSTVIRLGNKTSSDGERSKSWEEDVGRKERHPKRYSRESKRLSSSNTSGVGTFEHRSKRGDQRNQNNNNNSTGTPVFAWRQPKQNPPNQQTNNNYQGVVAPEDRRASQTAKRDGLTDLIMWLPSNGDEDYRQNDGNVVVDQNAFAVTDPMSLNQVQPGSDHPPYRLVANEYSGVFPSAPPEYPGIAFDPISKPWLTASRVSLAMDTIPLKGEKLASQKSMEPQEEKAKPKPLNLKYHIPTFAQHFRWYLANVFVRLSIEVGFVVMQVLLYGFYVPEMYKCSRWPCPNTVDCFISRPMEKTIFLWFMFLYSCICVLLNFVEFIYLIYAYAKKRAHKSSEESFLRNKKEAPLQPDKRFGRRYYGGQGVLGKHGIDPQELDLVEYQHRQLQDDASSMGSRFVQGHWGGRVVGWQALPRKGTASGSNEVAGSRIASRADTGTRDNMMAFVLDSDDERDIMEMEIEQIEQDELDFHDNDVTAEVAMDASNDQGDTGDNCI